MTRPEKTIMTGEARLRVHNRDAAFTIAAAMTIEEVMTAVHSPAERVRRAAARSIRGSALIMSSCPGSAAASRGVGLDRVLRGASDASVARHGLADIAVNDMPSRSAIVAIPFRTSDSCIATSELAPDHDVPRCAAAKRPYQLLNVVDLTRLKAMSELRYKINEYVRHIPVASWTAETRPLIDSSNRPPRAWRPRRVKICVMPSSDRKCVRHRLTSVRPVRHSAERGSLRSRSAGVFGSRRIITDSSGFGSSPTSVRMKSGPRHSSQPSRA